MALGFLVLVSLTMGSFGILVATWSDKFEQLSIVPTFVLTPLTYLGGVFYTLDALPPVLAPGESLQPDRVSGQRAALRAGGSERTCSLGHAAAMASAATLGFTLAAWAVVRSGWKLRA